MRDVILFALLGAAGFVAYEYWQYSNAIGQLGANAGSTLSFINYLEMKWGLVPSGQYSGAQIDLYNQMTSGPCSGSATQVPGPCIK